MSKQHKFKMPKGLFSKIIVVFCIAEMTIMQIWAMRIASHNSFLATGLLTANHSVFGGELLLLCVKRIFTKIDERQKKTEAIEDGNAPLGDPVQMQPPRPAQPQEEYSIPHEEFATPQESYSVNLKEGDV